MAELITKGSFHDLLSLTHRVKISDLSFYKHPQISLFLYEEIRYLANRAELLMRDLYLYYDYPLHIAIKNYGIVNTNILYCKNVETEDDFSHVLVNGNGLIEIEFLVKGINITPDRGVKCVKYGYFSKAVMLNTNSYISTVDMEYSSA